MNEHVPRLQVGQDGGEITAALNDGAGTCAKAHPHLAGDDMRQGRLAEPGRAGEEDMVEGFAPVFGGVDKDAQIVAQLALADEIVERQRPQRGLSLVPLGRLRADDARLGIVHCPSSCSPARISALVSALLPSRLAAAATAPNASTRR